VAQRNNSEGRDHYRDDSDLKRYRTEIPNMIFDIGLTPHEVALYCHIKRICGAQEGGVCWKSVSTLSKETGMSTGRVSEARAELSSRGLIRMSQPKGPGTGVVVTVVDIWPQNMARYSREDLSYYEDPPANPSEYEGPLQDMKGTLQNMKQRKNPGKKEPFKNYAEAPKSKEKSSSASARRREGYEWLFDR
jgi:Helix-turn-helix domain